MPDDTNGQNTNPFQPEGDLIDPATAESTDPTIPRETTEPLPSVNDDDLLTALCDSSGVVISPDYIEAKATKVAKCIVRVQNALIKWCGQKLGGVNDLISQIVSSILESVAPQGIAVSNLLQQIEQELMTWVAAGVCGVGELIGQIPAFPPATGSAVSSARSGVGSVGLSIGGSVLQTSAIGESKGGFSTGTAGAGFGGESAVGGGGSGATEESSQPSPSRPDPCADLTDEERVIWGCRTAYDKEVLQRAGVFTPELNGMTLKQFLATVKPSLADERESGQSSY